MALYLAPVLLFIVYFISESLKKKFVFCILYLVSCILMLLAIIFASPPALSWRRGRGGDSGFDLQKVVIGGGAVVLFLIIPFTSFGSR